MKEIIKIPSQPSFRRVFGVSLGVTFILFILRFPGFLQPVELLFYDFLMRSRPHNNRADDRLLIIEITQKDIENQEKYCTGNRLPKASLPDCIYSQLFEKLEKYNPKVIGLDIYRPFYTQEQKLKNYLTQTSPAVFVVCSNGEEQNYPEDVSIERIGFSDFPDDPVPREIGGTNGMIRRQYLRIKEKTGEDEHCPTQYSFSLQLAYYFLGKEPTPMTLNETSDNEKIGDVIFPSVEAFTSGYQDIDAGGHQVLLNYRSLDTYKDIAPHLTLDEILRDKTRNVEAYKNRIILIGISDPRNRDEWSTPYEDKVPGVYIQAQMISQILDVVEGKRSLIRVLPQWAEWFWIWVFSLVGGILGWYCHSWRGLLIAQVITLFSLWIICWAFFISNLWLPLIPLFIASSLTNLVFFWNQFSIQKRNN